MNGAKSAVMSRTADVPLGTPEKEGSGNTIVCTSYTINPTAELM
jgi:hypothetical protein